MEYQVTCSCGNVITVSEDMAGLSIPCGCGRTVTAPSPWDTRTEAITGSVPPPAPDLVPAGDVPPTPSPVTEIIPPMQVYLRTERGGRPEQAVPVLAALTLDTIWIQETWQLRPVPLHGLSIERSEPNGMELALTRGSDPTTEKLILEFTSAADGKRWHTEIQGRQQHVAPRTPQEDRRQPEGVALVRQAPEVPHVVLE